ncbi:H/ACA ribonucleoprotein complex subunit 2-like protein isoform X2 [Simochromis diagramma]|uniref:H/ACA ribonucleoprotein complex subunit 2-like protein isoform X2 n=1 Tax=Simochromis diagramma TaxID=43689 RepID=UPI001A7E8395|nr:H/ACA ribonucleoprotein complex subunit 2-like protein isoform X2 [Simochromis diagramma]
MEASWAWLKLSLCLQSAAHTACVCSARCTFLSAAGKRYSRHECVSERCVTVTSQTVTVRTSAQASVSLPAVSDHVDTAARALAAGAPAARALAAGAPQAADYTIRSSALTLSLDSVHRLWLWRSFDLTSCRKQLDLGSSAGSKRPTCVILIKPHEEYQEAYDECLQEVSSLPKPL